MYGSDLKSNLKIYNLPTQRLLVVSSLFVSFCIFVVHVISQLEVDLNWSIHSFSSYWLLQSCAVEPELADGIWCSVRSWWSKSGMQILVASGSTWIARPTGVKPFRLLIMTLLATIWGLRLLSCKQNSSESKAGSLAPTFQHLCRCLNPHIVNLFIVLYNDI